ncbi:hypothetical protein [Serratia marcescens]|uniref:hypothetical protein n=1 Tax=Serratia marcescens TaxID=615 RepID=UPI000A0FEFD7|nr:hypothetical protein [Serratia marcescens]UJA56147.1 hypothetical protein L1F17_09730 [Serratia marcescens]
MSIEKLKAVVDLLLTKPSRPFQVGDVIVRKPGVGDLVRVPEEGQKVVITDVAEEPVFDAEKSSGSPYFKHPLDIRVALFDRDGDLVEYWMDSRRFQHAE